MKLATYRDGTRDGELLVVSRDLRRAHFASHIARHLQAVLDDWNFLSPQLEDLYTTLNHGQARHDFAFEAGRCMAPLPRACQCVVATPAGPLSIAGDVLRGPQDELEFAGGADAYVSRPLLAVYTGDLPLGAATEQILDGQRLFALAHQVVRGPLNGGAALGAVPAGEQPRLVFSPVAATVDEWEALGPRPSESHPGPKERRPRREATLVRHFMAARTQDPLEPCTGVVEADEEALISLVGLVSGGRPVQAGSIFAVPWLGDAAAAEALRWRPGDRIHFDLLTGSRMSLLGAIEHGLAMGARPSPLAPV